MSLPDNLGLTSLEKLSTPGAGAEKGWARKQRAYFMGEGKSLIFKVLPSKHLLSTHPAGWIWWGETERHCLSDRSSEAANELASDPKVWGQQHGPPHALPWRREVLARSDPSGHGCKCGKKHLFCPMWSTDACSASVTSFLVWVPLGAAVLPRTSLSPLPLSPPKAATLSSC